jgi:hypothetical protein
MIQVARTRSIPLLLTILQIVIRNERTDHGRSVYHEMLMPTPFRTTREASREPAA